MIKYKPTYAPSRSSITVPNQSLSVDEILSRFTRGMSLPLSRLSNDDPQNLSEDDQMLLHECEDDFERMQTLIDIEELNSNSRQSEDSETKRSEVKSSSRRREENINPSNDSDNNLQDSQN